MPSYVVQNPNLQRTGPVVNLDVGIGATAEALRKTANVALPAPIPVEAMIDTGASVSVIQSGLPLQLGLTPIGVATISTASSAKFRCPQYAMRLLFANQVVFEATLVAAPLQGHRVQLLIGRDLLTQGVFVYMGCGNTFSLSF